jgi:hypothetical protein
MKLRLSNEQFQKWLVNLIKFTAPALAVLFFQLSQGVPIEAAAPLALYALYALAADYLKKLQ